MLFNKKNFRLILFNNNKKAQIIIRIIKILLVPIQN